jgi:hypothetical protein
VGKGARRTPLDPPPDTAGERMLRSLLGVVVVVAFALRFAGRAL